MSTRSHRLSAHLVPLLGLFFGNDCAQPSNIEEFVNQLPAHQLPTDGAQLDVWPLFQYQLGCELCADAVCSGQAQLALKDQAPTGNTPVSVFAAAHAAMKTCFVCQYDPDFDGAKSTCNSAVSEAKKEKNKLGRQYDVAEMISRADAIPKGDLAGCDVVEYMWQGHGLGAKPLARRAADWIRALPGTTRFNFVDLGCSTFSDLKDARDQMAIVANALNKNQMAGLWGNQTTVGTGAILDAGFSGYGFTVTSNGIVAETPAPCDPGASCRVDGETKICSDNGTKRKMTCKGLFLITRTWEY
jgi:hypothetical protein